MAVAATHVLVILALAMDVTASQTTATLAPASLAVAIKRATLYIEASPPNKIGGEACFRVV